MEQLKKIITDATTGVSYERPLTVSEIAQLDRDKKEAEVLFSSISETKKKIENIKIKLLNKEFLTEEEVSLLFGE